MIKAHPKPQQLGMMREELQTILPLCATRHNLYCESNHKLLPNKLFFLKNFFGDFIYFCDRERMIQGEGEAEGEREDSSMSREPGGLGPGTLGS